MDRAKFEAIVKKMEGLNARDPRAYLSKVQRFATFGFAVFAVAFLVFLVLLIALTYSLVTGGLSAGVGTLKVALILAIVIFAFARSLVFKVDPPEGREVLPEEAPFLFQELERIQSRIGAPPIYRILLDQEFNAFATSSTKFGMFGERCYVVLGLPLLATQRLDEVLATLGHELAHHGRSHVRYGMRAYRLEAMWHRVLYQMGRSGSILTVPLAAFVKWYSPRFSAMSLVLRRQAEYEADAVGAEATSKQAMAIGLVRMGVDGQTLLRDYYEDVSKSARTSATPVSNFFSGLEQSDHREDTDVRTALVNVLRSQTVYHDSHPSIRERTEAMGIASDPENAQDVENVLALLTTPGPSAGAELFGDKYQAILAEFDAQWAKDAEKNWQEMHADYEDSRKHIDKFEGRDIATLDEKEAVEYIGHAGHLKGAKEVTSETLALFQKFPENPNLMFYAGFCYLANGDEQGVDLLKKVADIEPSLKQRSIQAIASFREDRGESLEASELSFEAQEAQEAINERYSRLYQCHPGDPLEEFGGDEEELQRIASVLHKVPKVKAAFAIRKTEPKGGKLYLDLVVLVVYRPSLVNSDEEFLSKQTSAAYEATGSIRGIYLTTVYASSPVGKFLLKGGARKLFDATESRGPA